MLVVLDPIPMGEIDKLVLMAERTFVASSNDLLLSAPLAARLGVSFVVVRKGDDFATFLAPATQIVASSKPVDDGDPLGLKDPGKGRMPDEEED